ncbi:cytochrome oxidase small assembly protein [Achromobacter aloeverae]|nr:cytochrome oxidase small assembly protein [Achromobacter aloeverae]
MTPEQRRRNKTVGLALLAVVLVIFVWALFKGSSLFTPLARGGI